jgi:hypothetical protein
MRLRVLSIAAVLLATTACLEPLDPPRGRLGLIVMDTYESGADLVLKPVATFYDRTSAAFAAAPTDTCFIANYSVGGTFTNVQTMSVGAEISMVTPSGIHPLVLDDATGFLFYEAEAATGIVFTPGDTVEAQIPGNGTDYPAVNITVRTAESFTHDDVPVPEAADANIDLVWTAAPEPGSIMSFSLRYVTPGSTTGLVNQQVFCGLADDGAYTIHSSLLGGWRNAQNNLRELKVTRLRHSAVTVDTRTMLHLVSTFSRPTPTPP